MSQRVNIQYSIDIAQLPQEIKRLAKNVDSKLEIVGKTKLTKNNKEIISLESVKKIVELRQLLSEVDFNLMDIENIMTGYIRFQMTPQEAVVPEQQTNDSSTHEIYPDEELLDNLEAKIKNFKNTLSENNTNDQDPAKKHKLTEQVNRPNT